MKKLILLLFIPLVFACSSDSSDESGNILNGNNNYFFEIDFRGETHIIEGSSTDMSQLQNGCLGDNTASGAVASGDLFLIFKMGDITCDSYVSGDYINISLYVPNPQLGNNQGSIDFYLPLLVNPYVENSPMSNSEAYESDLVNLITDINITDLGTSPDLVALNGYNGETVKGSYSGVLYFWDYEAQYFSVPEPISISFEAYRIQ